MKTTNLSTSISYTVLLAPKTSTSSPLFLKIFALIVFPSTINFYSIFDKPFISLLITPNSFINAASHLLLLFCHNFIKSFWGDTTLLAFVISPFGCVCNFIFAPLTCVILSSSSVFDFLFTPLVTSSTLPHTTSMVTSFIFFPPYGMS